MSHSFIAYIDESGDDGLSGRFREVGRQGGASHWLSIGALVWRVSRDLDFVGHAKDIIAQLPEQKRRKPIHFKDIDHPQRVMAVTRLAQHPARLICVLAHKPSIPNGTFVRKNQLYHYMSRYLIERISWLCRDFRKVVPEGDGRVKIVFARRGGMSYADFRDYLIRLQAADDPTIRIHWPVIDIDGIEARDQSERYGLQLADVAVSGLNWALEPDYYGNTEARFARSLKPIIYQRSGNFLSYGAKLVPSPDRLDDVAHIPDFLEIFRTK